jgi:multidrug resistance efflux pump
MTAIRRPLRYAWILGVVVLLASAIGAGVVLNPSRAGNASTDRDPEPTGEPVTAIGHVDTPTGVTSLYPVQPGEVVKVWAEENQTYKKDKVLLVLDNTLAKAKRDEAQADLDAAEEALRQARKLSRQYEIQKEEQRLAIQAAKEELARAKHERDYKAFQLKHNNVRQEIVDAADAMVRRLQIAVDVEKKKMEELGLLDAEGKVRIAEEAVKAKQAKWAQAKYAVDHCVLKAPEDGMVLRVLVNKAEVLGPQPKAPVILFRPTKGDLIVRAEIEQEYAARVAVGKTAVIEDDTRAGNRWRGSVKSLSEWYTHRRSIILEPLNYNDVRTMECIVTIDPGQPKLRIGQRVRVTIGGSH